MQLHCANYKLSLDRPLVMGILNVTPDSFSDGGQHHAVELAVEHALMMCEAGADIIDVGGESTRPNASPVSVDDELARVLPVITALVRQVDIPISIDTYKPIVMQAAIDAGASMVNDVRALQEEGALAVVAKHTVAVCLMHMQGNSKTMQLNPKYTDVVAEVCQFLQARLTACTEAGIANNRLLIDPGFGFGKTRAHNIALIQQLTMLTALAPTLVGLSRKSVLGQVTGNDIDARLYASVAAAVIAAMKGAKIIRVHDVKATVEALKVVSALQST